MTLAAFVEEGTRRIESLFVPFADQTTGTETYSAGRYLDLHPDADRHLRDRLQPRLQPVLRLQRHLRVSVSAAVEPAEAGDSRGREGARRMSRPLQAIVFDFDGVIANSEPLHLLAFQQALAEDGVELSASDYYSRYLGYDDVGMFEALGRDRGTADAGRPRVRSSSRARATACRRCCSSGSVLFPGALEFIREAAAAVPIAIASGALRHEIDEIIDAAGVAESLRHDRRGRRHAGEQTVAGAVSAGVRAVARADRACPRPATLGRHRGLALGSRVGARRRPAAGRRDQQLSGGGALGRRARRRRARRADVAGVRQAVRQLGAT